MHAVCACACACAVKPCCEAIYMADMADGGISNIACMHIYICDLFSADR